MPAPAAPPPTPDSDAPTSNDRVEFTEEIERQAMNLVLRDLNFAIKWSGLLLPEHWNHPWHQFYFRAVEYFIEKYNKLPSLSTIKDMVEDMVELDAPFDDMCVYLDQIATTQVDDHGYIKDKLLEHCRHFDWGRTTVEMAGMVRDARYGDIEPLVKQVLIRHQDTQLVEEYMSGGREAIIERLRQENEGEFAHPTRFPELNKRHGGGFEKSTLTIYMGPSGSGKSIHLVNDGAHFLKSGKNVFHFTFELSREATMARYDVVLTGINHENRKANPEALADQLIRMRQRMGELYIIQWPTGECSIQQVEATLQEYEMLTGIKPDVVILDYLTIMKPNNTREVDMTNNYDRHKRLAEEARALAMSREIPVISAVQTTRGSINKDLIINSDVAESFAIIHVADLVLTINQTVAEKENHQMRLFVSKSRNHEDYYTIACVVNYDNLQIMENAHRTDQINTQGVQAIHDKSTEYAEQGRVMPKDEIGDTLDSVANKLAVTADSMGKGPSFKTEPPPRPVTAVEPKSVAPTTPPAV